MRFGDLVTSNIPRKRSELPRIAAFPEELRGAHNSAFVQNAFGSSICTANYSISGPRDTPGLIPVDRELIKGARSASSLSHPYNS